MEQADTAQNELATVRFYEQADDALLKFAVILAKSDGKWIFCKHKARNTYEIPGGHREQGEAIDDTAKRELYEETGAVRFQLTPVCIYSVTAKDNFDGAETFGKLYYAEVQAFESELHNEIEKIIFTKEPITNWTYPQIQPALFREALRRGFC